MMCMGYYIEDWENLPKKFPYMLVLSVIALVIHIVLPLPIYLLQKREENRDIEQQHQNTNNKNNSFNAGNKYFMDMIFTYFMVFILITEYAGAFILNGYVGLLFMWKYFKISFLI